MRFPCYLTVFVSPQGSYASFTSSRGNECVAWSAAGVQEQEWITFGIELDDYEGRPGPGWCQPFTLYWSGGGKVRLVAANEVGRRGGETRLFTHDGQHDIIARVASLSPRFDLPVFSRQAIYGIRLGPVAAQRGEPRITVSKLRRPIGGAVKKDFSAWFEQFPGESYGGVREW